MDEVYPLLCELEDRKLPADPFKEVFIENLSIPSVNYFVCESNDTIVAFASLHIQHLLHHCSKVAEIQELVVTAEYKGNGIGKKLLDQMAETAQKNGCSLLEVCCSQKRRPSHGFYEHCGMEKSHYKFTHILSRRIGINTITDSPVLY